MSCREADRWRLKMEVVVNRDQETPDLWGYLEAASFLGFSLGTLYNKVSAGEVPFVRLGPRTVRFEPDQLTRWVAARRAGARVSNHD